MLYKGYYINLDRSAERRAAIDAQLGKLNPGGRYHRFAAIEGDSEYLLRGQLSAGEIGCFYSHYLLLQMHLDGASHLHVLEDDAVLAVRAVAFIDQVIAAGLLDDVDILFTYTTVPETLGFCREGREQLTNSVTRAADGTATDVRFSLIPYYYSCSSYLVNRASVAKICQVLADELESGAPEQIDRVIRARAAEGKLRVKCLFPFITSVVPGALGSTIRQSEAKETVLATELYRHSFFVECDVAAFLPLAEQRLGAATPLERLHGAILAFLASDAYQKA